MTKNISDSVSAALKRLFDRDADLLLNDVNERSITHRLAMYLEDEFPDWHVDCEYNRNHDGVKRLKGLRKETVTIDNTNGVSVFPDIIIHRRMTDKNHLVIEVKKSTNSETPDFDLEKLRGFKEELGYTHALFILLVTGKNKPDAQLTWIDDRDI